MKKQIIGYFLMFLIIIPSFLNAQETTHFLKPGLGTGFLSVRDKGMSPLLYSGTGYFFSLAYEKASEKRINSIGFNLTYGKIKHKKPEVGILHNGRIEITYYHLRQIMINESSSLFFGGSLGQLAAYRYQPFFLNSAHNYEIIHSAGIVALINYKVLLNQKQLILTGTINIPAVSGVIRPAYASPLPEGLQTFRTELSKAYLESIQLVSFARFIRINNCFSANFPVFRKHLLGLSYQWDFYRLKTKNPVVFAGHRILLSMVINLK